MSVDDRFAQQTPKKSGWERFWELGPAWISALSTLIAALTGFAGFLVGRASAPSSRPRVIVRTVTVAVSPANSPGGTATPTPTPTPDGTPTSSPGERLGSYTFTLPANESAPLGSQAPTAQQILAAGSGGDVYWATGYAGAFLVTSGGNRIVSLPDGTTPTYQKCRDSAQIAPQQQHNPGTAFCIIETTGKMAGVYVDSVNQSPASIVLTVSIWNNSSS